MGYQKILVDNTKCQRRFHLTFDNEAKAKDHVEVKCLHCGAVVFARSHHPDVTLAREENLVKTSELSPYRSQTCFFEDSFSPEPKPK